MAACESDPYQVHTTGHRSNVAVRSGAHETQVMIMTKKEKSNTKRDPNEINVTRRPGEDEEVTLDRTTLLHTVLAALTLWKFWQKYGDLDLSDLVDLLDEQTQSSKDGNLNTEEEMFLAQLQARPDLW